MFDWLPVLQEWQQSTVTHVSIVRDLVDLQLNQYQQVDELAVL